MEKPRALEAQWLRKVPVGAGGPRVPLQGPELVWGH